MLANLLRTLEHGLARASIPKTHTGFRDRQLYQEILLVCVGRTELAVLRRNFGEAGSHVTSLCFGNPLFSVGSQLLFRVFPVLAHSVISITLNLIE
jgi:hypothetical protein